MQVKLLRGLAFNEGQPPSPPRFNSMQLLQRDHALRKSLYQQLKLKMVQFDNGAREWFGCSRDTPRCFGDIVGTEPSYLASGRWTPPCCLANLRRTASHVIAHLAEVGVRFWLEGASLLGAMRGQDLLKWDNVVDVGFQSGDLYRSYWMVKARDRPTLDEGSYVWEKATGGNFFRVYYSKTNRVYVNVLPFYPHNGTMVRDGWYNSGRREDFPEHFLHPMSTIGFAGRQVPSPNNIRDFLEHKYWKGVVDNQLHPNDTVSSSP